jgi:hypothetical protein
MPAPRHAPRHDVAAGDHDRPIRAVFGTQGEQPRDCRRVDEFN